MRHHLPSWDFEKIDEIIDVCLTCSLVAGTLKGTKNIFANNYAGSVGLITFIQMLYHVGSLVHTFSFVLICTGMSSCWIFDVFLQNQ